MQIEEIKSKLLSTTCFQNNEYLNKYCELITTTGLTKHIKFKTQKHHIIPKCVFRYLKRPINNSLDNLIELKSGDHILAHYYLVLATKDTLKIRDGLAFAFIKMLNNSHYLGATPDIEAQLIEELKDYDVVYQAFIQNQTKAGEENGMYGKTHKKSSLQLMSDKRKIYQATHDNVSKRPEVAKKISQSLTNHVVLDETKEKLRYYNTHKIYITNGEINKTILPEFFEEWEKQGFYKGKTQKPRTETSHWMHLNDVEALVPESLMPKYIENGYIQGRYKIYDFNKKEIVTK